MVCNPTVGFNLININLKSQKLAFYYRKGGYTNTQIKLYDFE